MRPALWLVSLAFTMFLVALAPRARADDASVEWRATPDDAIAVETKVSADGAGKKKSVITLKKLDAKLAATGTAIPVYDGTFVAETSAVRAGSAAVVLFRGGATSFVKVALIDLAAGKATKTIDFARAAPAGYQPMAAVACADADGFTVLWQEQKSDDPTQEALSWFSRVKPDGTIAKAPVKVAVPWSLGALVDDGRGYTLAVNFDGAAPDQTRLCFVTLSKDGAPEQHPWWGTRPGLVDDVQLAVVGGAVSAVYRGGKDGKSLLTMPANKGTGQWGKDPGDSKVLATSVAASQPYALRVEAGALKVLKL